VASIIPPLSSTAALCPLTCPCRAGFTGTSHQETPNTHPGGKWPVSLATAPALSGPWTRYNPGNTSAPGDAPCVNINGVCLICLPQLCLRWLEREGLIAEHAVLGVCELVAEKSAYTTALEV